MIKMPDGVGNKDNLDFGEDFTRGYDLLENTKDPVFITGCAGTGKSTLLRYFCSNTVKRVAVLAPTGVAAINVRGQTIHSFFGFKPDITPHNIDSIRVSKQKRKMYQSLDMIIIDEISMVRADLLDCIDSFLRMYGLDGSVPFGGVQMAFFGDLFQLPPVVSYQDKSLFQGYYNSPYFFDSYVFKNIQTQRDCENFVCVELKNVYRQKDEHFIDLLSYVRDNSINEEQLNELNTRYCSDYQWEDDELLIYLTTTNVKADALNRGYLDQLSGDLVEFEGGVEGYFDKRNYPTSLCLGLKLGSQIMLLNNDPMGRWVNGSIGRIISFSGDTNNSSIRIELSSGGIINVKSFTWDMFKFFYDEKNMCLKSESVGSFTQFPIKLAWAVTIHKSQGKSFDKVIVDIDERTFAHGQMYVALTRCTSFEGLILKKRVRKSDIIVDPHVIEFTENNRIMGQV